MALLAVGERELTALTDDVPARRYLDQAWNNGFTDEVLAAGQWKFARRTQQISRESSVTAEFGHPYAFAIPTDHIRTVAVCADEFFRNPLTDYQVEGGHWLASINPIYVSFVSNAASYGGDLSRWQADVVEYARFLLAQKIVPRLSGNKTDLERLDKKTQRALKDAKSSDAMEGPTAFPPTGSWVRARMRGRTGYDRGSRTSLIG